MLASQFKINSFESLMQIANIVAQSKCFDGVNSSEEAAARILVGMELGLGPMTSIKEVRIDRGKVILSASVQAAIVKTHADYEVVQLDNEACELMFIDAKGKALGTHRFTKQDAAQAKLLSGRNAHTWAAYMRDMLFSRCVAAGSKKYFPQLFSGISVYTEEEVSSIDSGSVALSPTFSPALSVAPTPAEPIAQPKPAPVQVEPEKDLTPPWPLDEPVVTPAATTPAPEPEEIPFITGIELNALWQKANASRATKPGFALLLRNYIEMNGSPKGQPLTEITEMVRAAIKGGEAGRFPVSPNKIEEIGVIAGNADLMATWNQLADQQA